MPKTIGIKQKDCNHAWRVYKVRPGTGEVLMIRYRKCKKCGSTMRTEERPVDFKHKR